MDWLRNYPEKQLWRIYYVCLVVSLVIDFYWLYTHVLHYHFAFQYIPQFFAILGFAGCMLLIVIAKAMGFFIVVDENYSKAGGENNQEDQIE